MMDSITLDRKQAERRYGPAFLAHIMKDQPTITVSAFQDRALADFNQIKMGIMTPYRYPIIYVVETDGGVCKVGQTFNIKKRVRAFDTGIPSKCHLRHVEMLDGAPVTACERAVHALLSAVHVAGEWFKVLPDDAIEAVMHTAKKMGGSIRLSDAWAQSEAREKIFRSAMYGDPGALRRMTDAKEAFRWGVDRLAEDTA